jgi:hypothetical protein
MTPELLRSKPTVPLAFPSKWDYSKGEGWEITRLVTKGITYP